MLSLMNAYQKVRHACQHEFLQMSFTRPYDRWLVTNGIAKGMLSKRDFLKHFRVGLNEFNIEADENHLRSESSKETVQASYYTEKGVKQSVIGCKRV